jgi:hypothetical protein
MPGVRGNEYGRALIFDPPDPRHARDERASNFGSLAMFAAILRASSLLTLPELEVCFGLEKRQTDSREEKLMSARTAAATVEKSLAVESTIEAEINSLIQEQIPKRIPVEQQTPKRVQIEDDAEKSRSFVARITSNSIDELGELASDLTSALQNLQEYLKAEGERVQREILDYAHLNRTALAAIKTIIETTRAPSNEKDGEN